jgi:integrase
MLQQRQRGEPNDLLFVARDGGTIDAISDTFERVVDKVGLNNGVKSRAQKVVFHTLRHTFASWLAIQGTPSLTIMELMGHKDIKMTMRYAHLIPDQKRTAVHSLDSSFRGSRPETDQEQLKS